MPELPGLHNLIGTPDTTADDGNRVLKRHPGDRSQKQPSDEIKRRLLLDPFAREMPRTRHGQMGTRRVRNEQIPTIAEQKPHIADHMRPWPL
jgi:hypothetical protein